MIWVLGTKKISSKESKGRKITLTPLLPHTALRQSLSTRHKKIPTSKQKQDQGVYVQRECRLERRKNPTRAMNNLRAGATLTRFTQQSSDE